MAVLVRQLSYRSGLNFLRSSENLDGFYPIEGFFELHSRATEGEKGKKWAKRVIF